jgi:hypothetical protein
MRVSFVSAVPAMIGAVVWGVWDAHVTTERAVAAESWTPPPHVGSRADPPTVAVEPGTEPIDAEPSDRTCRRSAKRVIAVRHMQGAPSVVTQGNYRKLGSPIDDFTDPMESR